MIKVGVFFDIMNEEETKIYSFYQQNHNQLLHRGQIFSDLQEEILHQTILETKNLLHKLEDKEFKIDVYGYKDGHDNAIKFINYIQEHYPESCILGYIKVTP